MQWRKLGSHSYSGMEEPFQKVTLKWGAEGSMQQAIQRKILVVWGYSEYTGSHRSGLESWGLLKIPAVTSEWPGHSSSPGEKVRVRTAWGSMLRAGLRNQAHRAGMAQFPVYILLSSEGWQKNKQTNKMDWGFWVSKNYNRFAHFPCTVDDLGKLESESSCFSVALRWAGMTCVF